MSKSGVFFKFSEPRGGVLAKNPVSAPGPPPPPFKNPGSAPACRGNNVAGSKFRHVMDNTGPRSHVGVIM